MIDELRFAGWIAPLHGRPLRLQQVPGKVFVTADARASSPRETVAKRFLRFPGTSGGYVLLDAEEPAVLRAGIRLLPQGRAFTRFASRLVRASSYLGVARGLAAGELALLQAEDASPRPLCERFADLPQDLAWNVASGVPGPDQKTIVQLVSRAGRVEGYAKIAQAESSRALVRREAAILDTLAALGIPAPRCLGLESGPHGTLFVQTALEGRRWHRGFGRPQSRFLGRIERATGRRRRLSELASHRGALAGLAALRTRAEPAWWELMQELAQCLETVAGATLLPCAMAHGDFTPWNSVVAGVEARAFDWEHAREEAPRLHDAFHFVLQSAVLVEHAEPGGLRKLLEARTADLPAEAWALQLGAYLLDVSVADATRGLGERAPSGQAHSLRRARTALARELLEEMRNRGTWEAGEVREIWAA